MTSVAERARKISDLQAAIDAANAQLRQVSPPPSPRRWGGGAKDTVSADQFRPLADPFAAEKRQQYEVNPAEEEDVEIVEEIIYVSDSDEEGSYYEEVIEYVDADDDYNEQAQYESQPVEQYYQEPEPVEEPKPMEEPEPEPVAEPEPMAVEVPTSEPVDSMEVELAAEEAPFVGEMEEESATPVVNEPAEENVMDETTTPSSPESQEMALHDLPNGPPAPIDDAALAEPIVDESNSRPVEESERSVDVAAVEEAAAASPRMKKVRANSLRKLARSGSFKGIRKGIKKVGKMMRRRSGKGNSKADTSEHGREIELEGSEAAPVDETVLAVESEPVVETEETAEHEPVEEPEPVHELEQVAEPEPEPEAVAEPEPDVEPEPEPVDEPQPVVESKPVLTPKAVQRPESKAVEKPAALVVETRTETTVTTSSVSVKVIENEAEETPSPPSSPKRSWRNPFGKKQPESSEKAEAAVAPEVTAPPAIAAPTVYEEPKPASEEITYSYAKDGRTYYTNKPEKKANLEWEKPDWTASSPLRSPKKSVGSIGSPQPVIEHKKIEWEKPDWTKKPILKPTEKGQQLKTAGTLEKPITFPLGKGEGINTEVQPDVVLRNKVTGEEKTIGWEKPDWTKKPVLKATGKGEALRSGVEIARPITMYD